MGPVRRGTSDGEERDLPYLEGLGIWMRLWEQRVAERQGDAYGNGGGLGSVTPAIFRLLHFPGYRGSLTEQLGVSEFAQLSLSLRYHMS